MKSELTNVTKQRKVVSGLTLYYVMFFLVWAMFELWLDPFVKTGTGFAFHTIFRRVSKFVIWVIPVCLYLKYIDREQILTFIKADRFTKQSAKWTLIGIGVYCIRSLIMYVFAANPKINFDLGLDVWLGAVLLVGLTEETVFRGFLLEKIKRINGFWCANIISSILFVSIHFPVWYTKGTLLSSGILFTIISVFLIGIFQGYIYQKGESIWASIICHSVTNLLVLCIVI